MRVGDGFKGAIVASASGSAIGFPEPFAAAIGGPSPGTSDPRAPSWEEVAALPGAGKGRAGNWDEALILSDKAKAARRSPPPGSPSLLEQFQDQLRILVGDRQRLDA